MPLTDKHRSQTSQDDWGDKPRELPHRFIDLLQPLQLSMPSSTAASLLPRFPAHSRLLPSAIGLACVTCFRVTHTRLVFYPLIMIIIASAWFVPVILVGVRGLPLMPRFRFLVADVTLVVFIRVDYRFAHVTCFCLAKGRRVEVLNGQLKA